MAVVRILLKVICIIFLARVVAKSGKETEICGRKFTNFGSHCDNYHMSYLTAAASIGMSREEVDLFVSRLDKVLSGVYKDKVPAKTS